MDVLHAYIFSTRPALLLASFCEPLPAAEFWEELTLSSSIVGFLTVADTERIYGEKTTCIIHTEAVHGDHFAPSQGLARGRCENGRDRPPPATHTRAQDIRSQRDGGVTSDQPLSLLAW